MIHFKRLLQVGVSDTLSTKISFSSEAEALIFLIIKVALILGAVIIGFVFISLIYNFLSDLFIPVKREQKENIDSSKNVKDKIKTQNQKINVDTNSNSNNDILFTPELKNHRINYYLNDDLINKYSFERNKYPYILLPKPNSYVKLPVIGKEQKKGAVENTFLNHLIKNFKDSYKVFDDRVLFINKISQRFEPDFVFKSNSNKSLFIDIEIDEPYDGVSKKPIHLIEQNKNRDEFFINSGWIVVRFTEHQILSNPNGCLNVIKEGLSSIISNQKVSNTIFVSDEEMWDKEKALEHIKNRYRENYLGIDDFKENKPREINHSNVKVEKAIDKKRRNEIMEELRLSDSNRHKRDERIRFLSDEHKYIIDNKFEYPSVTKIIEEAFPKFDELKWSRKKAQEEKVSQEEILKRWDDKGKESADLGTKLHEDIENFYNGIKVNNNSTEFKYFLDFDKENIKGLKPFRTEWRIFDEKEKVAGTIDMVFIKEDGEIVIFDWKRSEKVVDKNTKKPLKPSFEYGFGRVSHIANNSFNKYVLQQSIYRYILEENYNLKVSSTNLLILHPELDNYVLLKKLPYWKKEATDLLLINSFKNI